MKGFIRCLVCDELHPFKKAHGVIAFPCPFLDGVIHLPFHSVEDIEKHKKEAEPKGHTNFFRQKGG